MNDQRYLIFGGTGSLGKKLIDRLCLKDGSDIAVYSRDEAKHWTIRNELSSKKSYYHKKVKFFVGDIRDYSRVKDVIRSYKPTRIIVAAALKQVDTCELSPSESVATNLLGTLNVVNAISELSMSDNQLEACLFVSTDKACSPVNVYGMCKALSERITTSQFQNLGHCRFLATRYGNVLESRGSIIPLFKYQAESSDYLTVTDPNMTRYVMTLDEAVDLIQHTFVYGKSGETWIPILPSMRIGDLAEIFAEQHGKEIKLIGLRPGEKLHEDLINESESTRTRDNRKHYDVHDMYSNLNSNHYIIEPAISPACYEKFSYSSDQCVMTKSELRQKLTDLGIIDMRSDEFKGLAIEEIVK